MDFKKITILECFDSSQKQYEIPIYQRAYSWDRDNLRVFFEDIVEHSNGSSNYFYGNILLERIEQGKKYEIIDGQQRLTTLVIFIRAILNVLKSKNYNADSSDFYEEKEKIYLKNGNNIKLRPVEYDRACFDGIIIDDKDDFKTSTPSQERIKYTKEYFIKQLAKLETNEILNILNKIESTELIAIEIVGKKDSVLMFELQNNRGKDLTNMERLKSYFMYQMYVYSDENEVNANIENISNISKEIYKLINDIKLEEDSVLFYHNQAYINGYAYRTLDDVKNIFGKVDKDKKVEWIIEYMRKLHTTFSNIKQFEHLDNTHKYYLECLGISAFIYPFIIKGFRFLDSSKIDELFQVLEILLFRAKLINTRAKIQERLNAILSNFNNDDIAKLRADIKNKLNESGYWDDDSIEIALCGDMYNKEVINYLLWRYENAIQSKGYSIDRFSIEGESIEHISPQQPDNGVLENGYDVDENNQYDDEFIKEYLNCLGNLVLISKSHNSAIGNKPFSEKLESYNKNLLLKQQAEIKDFAKEENGKLVWKKVSIDERRDKIAEFALKTWSF
ncbi:hypothetical protein CCY99_05855 [Helicobacter sp. 16-1353]|uniref:DUF262 domain-containing protein n=1 Tax=Helicobacter sp. 16-1353 TaxID=2004996 RepID=UPI000DCAE4ED|nr:DUF262 domain-containing protein [Helicobacter sp. 16-1353]RAX53903.1 hypothetical protein CCY99_05855 [Helicobacter sp. 16-1353]